MATTLRFEQAQLYQAPGAQVSSVPEGLAQVALFASLGDAERAALAAACRVRAFKSGQVLFHQEDPGHDLYLIRSGRVKIVRLSPNGQETILHLAGPGECLGEMALLDEAPRSATATALEPVEALRLAREAFLMVLEQRPEVGRAVMRELVRRIRRLNEQVQDSFWLDLRGRIAKTLLTLAERHGQPSSQGIRIPLRLTREELAQLVGAARPTVSTELMGFREQGIVTVDRAGITLHRTEPLRKRLY
jgi:CRP/FNR family cyclic AMP-dependent transcriptional regulator